MLRGFVTSGGGYNNDPKTLQNRPGAAPLTFETVKWAMQKFQTGDEMRRYVKDKKNIKELKEKGNISQLKYFAQYINCKKDDIKEWLEEKESAIKSIDTMSLAEVSYEYFNSTTGGGIEGVLRFRCVNTEERRHSAASNDLLTEAIEFLISKEREDLVKLSRSVFGKYTGKKQEEQDDEQESGEDEIYWPHIDLDYNGKAKFHDMLTSAVNEALGCPKSKNAAEEAAKDAEKAKLLQHIKERVDAFEIPEGVAPEEDQTESDEEETSEES